MTENPIRVVQWATGNIGTRAMRAVIEHPEMDLVGLWVHSADKAGRDAAEPDQDEHVERGIVHARHRGRGADTAARDDAASPQVRRAAVTTHRRGPRRAGGASTASATSRETRGASSAKDRLEWTSRATRELRYSSSTAPRARLILARRFFSASRRSTAPGVGRVGRRFGGGGAPGRFLPLARSSSTSVPTLVFRKSSDPKVPGTPRLATAAAGNAWITASVYQIVLNVIDGGMPAQQAIEGPRFLIGRDPVETDVSRIQIEDRIPRAILQDRIADGSAAARTAAWMATVSGVVVTVSAADLLAPPSAAEIVTVPEAHAGVDTVNVVLVKPPAIVTLGATVATAGSLLESATTAPPAGAGPFSATVPIEEAPAVTLGGLRLSEDTVGGVTMRTALRATPS